MVAYRRKHPPVGFPILPTRPKPIIPSYPPQLLGTVPSRMEYGRLQAVSEWRQGAKETKLNRRHSLRLPLPLWLYRSNVPEKKYSASPQYRGGPQRSCPQVSEHLVDHPKISNHNAPWCPDYVLGPLRQATASRPGASRELGHVCFTLSVHPHPGLLTRNPFHPGSVPRLGIRGQIRPFTDRLDTHCSSKRIKRSIDDQTTSEQAEIENKVQCYARESPEGGGGRGGRPKNT